MIRSGCILKIGVIGLNHKTAGLLFREAVARGAKVLSGERALFFNHPTVLLSTCNRTEIYFSAEDLGEAHSDLLAFLRLQIEEPFEHRLYSYFGLECFAHLGCVAAGLDSAILAETEIQRQVKVAYARACEYAKLPSCLHYIFQKALHLSKSVRGRLHMQRGAPTLFHAVWHLAEEALGDLSCRKILLVGYSEINREMAYFLIRRGIKAFTLVTRRPEAVRLEGCLARDRNELEQWNEYDWIICAASSSDYLIQGSAQGKRAIFDLSVPRNVDPTVQSSTTLLYNIEQVNRWVEQKRIAQSDHLTACTDLVWEFAFRSAQSYRRKVMRQEHLAVL
jgi:glutamyl-tRNA reductase